MFAKLHKTYSTSLFVVSVVFPECFCVVLPHNQYYSRILVIWARDYDVMSAPTEISLLWMSRHYYVPMRWRNSDRYFDPRFYILLFSCLIPKNISLQKVSVLDSYNELYHFPKQEKMLYRVFLFSIRWKSYWLHAQLYTSLPTSTYLW